MSSRIIPLPSQRNFRDYTGSGPVVTDILFAAASKIPRPRLAVLRSRKTSLRPGHVLKKSAQALFFNHVRPAGIEPATVSLKGSCSTN